MYIQRRYNITGPDVDEDIAQKKMKAFTYPQLRNVRSTIYTPD